MRVSSPIRLALLLAALVCAPRAGASVLQLSEFMAVNTNSLLDEDGDYSDWMEIYNPGTSTVNLAGWHLTDSSNNLSKWTFPDTNIAAGGYAIVFASDKNRASAGAPLHSNFKLDGAGEYLALVEPNGSTVATEYAPTYPQQVANISYGIAPGLVTNLLFDTNAACRVRVPVDDSLGYDWIERSFDDSAWSNGLLGVGFDTVTDTNFPPDYRPYFRTDVQGPMYNINGSAYIRVPFIVSNPGRIQSLRLDLKFDDGFVAFINGEEVASVNDRDINTWNTRAALVHDVNSNVFESFVINGVDEILDAGTNVLAIHGMNNQTNSSDFLIEPRLLSVESASVENGLRRYFSAPTPGSANNAGTAQLGPPIYSVTHTPTRPLEAEDLVVRARIVGAATGVSTATVTYVVMFTNAVTTVPMTPSTGDVYQAVIPASAYGTGDLIRYYVSAVGTNGATNRWPLAEDTVQWLGTVAQDPAVTSSLPVFNWFVQDTGWHVRAEGGNNLNWTNGYVYFGDEFYDGVHMRVRGNSSSGWRKPHFKFEFSKGHYFNWSTNQEPVEEFNLQSTYSDKAYLRQVLSMETYRDAQVPYSSTFFTRVQQNGRFYSLAIWLEQPGEKYLARQGRDPAGALYKMFNTMTSSSSGVEKHTRKDESNADLQALVNGVDPAKTATARERYLLDNVDVPATINYIAATTIMHDTDHIAKNYFAYRDSEGDAEWTYMPWDKDLTFGRNYTTNNGGVLNDSIWADKDVLPAPTNRSPSHPLYGDDQHQKSDSGYNRLIDAMHDTPVIRNMYLRRLRTLMDQLLQTNGTPAAELRYESRIAQLRGEIAPDVELDRARWGNPYGSNQTLDVAIALLTNNYLSVRRTHLYVTHGGTNGAGIPARQVDVPSIQFGQIDYRPATSNQAQEYIELVNTNATAVDLSGWTLSNAVKFVFEPGTVVAARSNLYVSPDLPAFRARPTSPRSNESRFVVGPYQNSLSARGETIDLRNAAGALISSLSYTGVPGAFLENLRITEIMYHPEGNGDREYIELKNIGTNALNLAGVHFTGGVEFTFTNLVLAASGLTVVVRSAEAFTNGYDTSGISVAGVYSGALDNAGEKLTLLDPSNEEILDFSYQDGWVPLTDGLGYSLTITNALLPFDAWGSSNSWRASSVYRGTPGREEPDMPPGTILINEILTHSDIGLDWVELFNPGTNDVNIGNWMLSDSPSYLRKYRIPAGTVITAGTFRVIGESDFNNPTNPAALVPFSFSELGEEVHLSAAAGNALTGYHEMLAFDAAERNVSFGRYTTSDGITHFARMEQQTPGATNSNPKVGPLVVTELMYDPDSNGTEFVEIQNISNSVVQLYDPLHPSNRWRLASAVDFTFPTNRTVPVNGFVLVVPTDPSQFRSTFRVPSSVSIFGPYTGRLDNAGESVQLQKPTDPETNGLVPYVTVDQVDYVSHAPWPVPPTNGNYSIEKMTNSAYADEPAAWRVSNRIGSPGTVPQVDANNDGIPDNWQLLHFLTTNAVGYGDWDFDGIQNQAEYVYGSQPTNAASGSHLSISNNGTGFWIMFPTYEASGPGYFGLDRYYDLESGPSATGPWTSVGSWLGVNGTNVYSPSMAATMDLYRVRAWLQAAP